MNLPAGVEAGDLVLFGVVAALGVNHVVLRIPGLEGRLGPFAVAQGLNLGAIVLLGTLGVPGFTGGMKVMNFVLCGLFVLHAIQNTNRWAAARAEARSSAADEKRARIAAALQRGEERPPPPAGD
jgi:hypothetical protein